MSLVCVCVFLHVYLYVCMCVHAFMHVCVCGTLGLPVKLDVGVAVLS